MPAKDWKALCKELRERIALPGTPVGVKLLVNPRELLDYKEAKLLSSTAPCHMAAMARYNQSEGVVGASDIGTKCTWGAACLGLMAVPERLRNGNLNRRFTRDDAAAKNVTDHLYMLGKNGKKFSGLMMAPLDHMPFEPDVIVMYMSPARALRIVIGFSYATGKPVGGPTLGQASLCQAIARAMDGQVTVDVPCMGDRLYGLVQEFELVVAFPASKIDELMEGLRGTESIASYPYKPFLQWSAIFPPEFEPIGRDFE